jgi:ornithine cyclodeaminase/alanine dehydrogenase-like protein (mu-crystallin family)
MTTQPSPGAGADAPAPVATLVLTRRDVARLLDLDSCIAAVERAFRAHAEGAALAPGVLGFHVPGGGFHIKAAGLLAGPARFAAKINANFPGNGARFGLPTIQGVVVLSDADCGAPLAVMDSGAITALRTAAATALAARHLARADARIATICGCGAQAGPQLAALTRVRPIVRAFTFDADAAKAAAFAQAMSGRLGIAVEATGDLAAATRASDIVVTCTPATRAYLTRDHVRPGTFVAAVGADSEDKQEIAPALMAGAKVVVDVLSQCAIIGDLHHALMAGVMVEADVHADLAEVIAGQQPGRVSDDEITLFDSTGTALQDVAAAVAVYERALAEGSGIAVRFGD